MSANHGNPPQGNQLGVGGHISQTVAGGSNGLDDSIHDNNLLNTGIDQGNHAQVPSDLSLLPAFVNNTEDLVARALEATDFTDLLEFPFDDPSLLEVYERYALDSSLDEHGLDNFLAHTAAIDALARDFDYPDPETYDPMDESLFPFPDDPLFSDAAFGNVPANNMNPPAPVATPTVSGVSAPAPVVVVADAAGEDGDQGKKKTRGKKRKAADVEEGDAANGAAVDGGVPAGVGVAGVPGAAGVAGVPPGGAVAGADNVPNVVSGLNNRFVPTNFQRRLPSVVNESDPWACPVCFHAFIRANTVREHLIDKHSDLGMTRKNFDTFEKYKTPQRLSHYVALGVDVTYRGNDRKQLNARRRMDAGIRTDNPEYLRDVYKATAKTRRDEQQGTKGRKKAKK